MLPKWYVAMRHKLVVCRRLVLGATWCVDCSLQGAACRVQRAGCTLNLEFLLVPRRLVSICNILLFRRCASCMCDCRWAAGPDNFIKVHVSSAVLTSVAWTVPTKLCMCTNAKMPGPARRDRPWSPSLPYFIILKYQPLSSLFSRTETIIRCCQHPRK